MHYSAKAVHVIVADKAVHVIVADKAVPVFHTLLSQGL